MCFQLQCPPCSPSGLSDVGRPFVQVDVRWFYGFQFVQSQRLVDRQAKQYFVPFLYRCFFWAVYIGVQLPSVQQVAWELIGVPFDVQSPCRVVVHLLGALQVFIVIFDPPDVVGQVIGAPFFGLEPFHVTEQIYILTAFHAQVFSFQPLHKLLLVVQVAFQYFLVVYLLF